MILLEQARLDKHLTVDALAAKTGISARTIQRLEAQQGGGAWDSTVITLAEFLGVKPSELLLPAPAPERSAA